MNLEPTVVHPRFTLITTVMVRETLGGAAVLTRLRNISLSGCYIETPRQIMEGTRLRVVLQTAQLRADLWGIVRRRDQTGLGIQFTNGATVEDWKRLESLITQLQDSSAETSLSASNAE
jgi:PilZ domain